MSTGLRARLTRFVTVGALVTLVVLTAGFNLALRASLDSDAQRLLNARAEAALQSVRSEQGKVTFRPGEAAQGTDSEAWVFAGGKTLVRPAGPPQVNRVARSLANGNNTTARDEASDTRLLAQPILEDGKRVGTVVAAISEEPYERTANRALYASIVFAAVMLIVIVAGARSVINRALRPVELMTREAADWSEHDLDHRFNAGEPHDELTHLAATFDGMLDRLASALRHEQLFSAEISHELRTPLAAIVTEAELALRRERTTPEYRESIERISTRARQLQDVLETLLIAAREEPWTGEGADAATAVERIVESFGPLAEERGIEVSSHLPGRLVSVQVGPATAERILSPVIENACAYANSAASVEVSTQNGTVRIVVSDDGPGVDPAEAEAIFEPGVRGQAGERRDGAGTGLGLALARRLARGAGGDVVHAGAGFEIRLPRSVSSTPLGPA
jgi:signal transduction histidine kinase